MNRWLFIFYDYLILGQLALISLQVFSLI